ncbi:MAG: 2-hydroxyacid dehydrogenase [Hyphomicrobiaceae bacterium]
MSFKIASTRDLRTAAGEACFHGRVFDVLKGNPNMTWEWLPETLTELTPDVMARYDGLHINSPRVSRAAVSRPDCRVKIIARNGVGFDTVDVAALSEKGIVLTNTPLAVRRPVAVGALTMIFALSGRLLVKDTLVRAGRWTDRANFMGVGLTRRTLGLIGAGGIGQEIVRLAKPFFARIIAADPYVDADKIGALGAEVKPFDTVMKEADFVVVCCLLNDETRHLIDAHAFGLMKPSAYFINMARGPIHDEAALIDALRSERIAGAGLDVTEKEPIDPDNPLLAMKNTIVTPHAVCWTDEAFEDIAVAALGSIVDFSLRRRPAHIVNPQVYDKIREG